MKEELTIDDCRPEIKDFAIAMERKLRKNSHKTSWEQFNYNYFLARIEEELTELTDAHANWILELFKTHQNNNEETTEDLMVARRKEFEMAGEAIDVANFAFFVYCMVQRGIFDTNTMNFIRELEFTPQTLNILQKKGFVLQTDNLIEENAVKEERVAKEDNIILV
jgi:hypothetical protein